MKNERSDESSTSPDMPRRVFERFLADLAAANQPPDVIARLREALIEQSSFGEKALRAALFSDAPKP